jgi:Uma2 family endonuclease
MPTRVAMRESEYLAKPFPGPEPDFVDGEMIARGMPTNHHSAIQFFFAFAFGLLGQRVLLFVRPELRLRIRPDRRRVADLAIFEERPTGEETNLIPLVVVEILTPDDRMVEVQRKLADYAGYGVPHIWIVNPMLRAMYVYADKTLREVDVLELPQYDLRFPCEQVMAQIID